MEGILCGDTVVVKDQKDGSRIYSRGTYGYPLKGGGVELDLIESVYLVECGRMDVVFDNKKLNFQSLFEYASSEEVDFDIGYAVYRDLRQRGYIVKTENDDFVVYPRGYTSFNSKPEFFVKAVSERSTLNIDKLRKTLSSSLAKERKTLYAIVDEEGDLTYYIAEVVDPTGVINQRMHKKAKGVLIRDKVLVFGSKEYEKIVGEGIYGKMMGDVLQLSLIEACSLIDAGFLIVKDIDGKKLSSKIITKNSGEKESQFLTKLSVYNDMRSKGLIVKAGFKYGVHFRVYESSPEKCHAKYLVHCVKPGEKMKWPEVSRAVRLSAGVKKEILFARAANRIDYLSLRWFRP